MRKFSLVRCQNIVSFIGYSLFYRALLQRRPIFLGLTCHTWEHSRICLFVLTTCYLTPIVSHVSHAWVMLHMHEPCRCTYGCVMSHKRTFSILLVRAHERRHFLWVLATHCNTLQHTAAHAHERRHLLWVAVCCWILAVCCYVLHHSCDAAHGRGHLLCVALLKAAPLCPT